MRDKTVARSEEPQVALSGLKRERDFNSSTLGVRRAIVTANRGTHRTHRRPIPAGYQGQPIRMWGACVAGSLRAGHLWQSGTAALLCGPGRVSVVGRVVFSRVGGSAVPVRLAHHTPCVYKQREDHLWSEARRTWHS